MSLYWRVVIGRGVVGASWAALEERVAQDEERVALLEEQLKQAQQQLAQSRAAIRGRVTEAVVFASSL